MVSYDLIRVVDQSVLNNPRSALYRRVELTHQRHGLPVFVA
jgi:hypothetical protein